MTLPLAAQWKLGDGYVAETDTTSVHPPHCTTPTAIKSSEKNVGCDQVGTRDRVEITARDELMKRLHGTYGFCRVRVAATERLARYKVGRRDMLRDFARDFPSCRRATSLACTGTRTDSATSRCLPPHPMARNDRVLTPFRSRNNGWRPTRIQGTRHFR